MKDDELNEEIRAHLQMAAEERHKRGESQAVAQLNARREFGNELLVKVDNTGGEWGFYLELRDPETNKPLQAVEFRTTPP